MIKEQAELLDQDFRAIVKDHNMRNGFAYFVDKADMAVMLFDDIDDNELMYIISNLISRIGIKYNMTVDEVMASLKEGMEEINKS